MPRNAYHSRRISFPTNPDMHKALRPLNIGRQPLYASLLASLVTPSGYVGPYQDLDLERIRRPFTSGYYWRLKSHPKGDEVLNQPPEAPRNLWTVDVTRQWIELWFECSEGIVPAIETINPNMFAVDVKVQTGQSYNHHHIPRWRDDSDKVRQYNGPKLVQSDNHTRERGFNLENTSRSNRMQPFNKALWMYAFSSKGEIPAVRAIILAAWAERFAQRINPQPGFQPMSFDDKWKLLCTVHETSNITHLLLSPFNCMQPHTPKVHEYDPVWGLIINKFLF